MRKLGKFLVYTNLVLSLLFLGWSVGLYTQRLDWAPHKHVITGEVTQESGKLYFLHDEIKRLVELRDLAEIRWQKDSPDVDRQEATRYAHMQWYKDQVLLAETGRDSKGKEDAQPVRKLVPDIRSPLGLYELDPAKRPAVQNRGKDLKSIAAYEKEYKDLKHKTEVVQEEINKLIEEIKRLTDKIVGVKDQFDGLRLQLDQRLAQKKLWVDEMAALHPLVVNQLINVEIHKKRINELEARMKELQAVVGRAN